MTPRIKIELRRSEIRTRLGEIAELTGDALTEDIGTERDGLMIELRNTEPQLRAAMEAEGGEKGVIIDGSAADAQLRALTAKASVGSIVSAVIEHRSTDGAAAELQEHYKLAGNQIPLAMLTEPVIETRAVTPAPADVGQTQSSIIPGVFPQMAGAWLSIDMPTVPVGDATFPVLTENADPATPVKGGDVAETTGQFSAEVLSPARIQASFFYNREDRARFMGMDEALRMNLSEALSSKLDEQIIAGPNGLLGGSNLTQVTATGTTSYGSYKDLVYASVDGIYAFGSADVRVLVAPETLAHMARTFLTNTDSRSADEALKEQAGGVRVSAHIPDASGNQQDTIVRKGMRRDMVAPMWEGVTLIPDEITKAASGQIVLTAVMLYAVKILRADGFRRVEVQFA